MEYRRVILYNLIALAVSATAYAGDIVVNAFGGLDTQDSPVALQPYQSQDLLNVLLQPGMRSVFKRDGYGLFQTLPTYSTAPVHGGYHFQQTSGSDVQLWGSDVNLFGSVSDATFVKVATGTVGATWQCTDNLGFAYCLTSSNDMAVKTDGTAANTTYQSAIPLGTMVTSTPLQLVVAGVSGSGSTLYISANNNFLNFTVGPLPTDPYTEIINAPGSRITHIAYYFGKLFWWKDQSFGYISGSSSQNTVAITIVSNQIGTLDNSSAFWNPTSYETQNAFSTGNGPTTSGNPYFNEVGSLGGIFFRGQDNHIYQYDGYTLTRLTRIISPTVVASNRKKSNSWTQTSQADFQTGASSQAFSLSTTISPGNVVLSTNVFNDYNNWNNASLFHVDSTTVANSLILSSFSAVSSPSNQVQLTNSGVLDTSVVGGVANWMAQGFTTSGGAQQLTAVKFYMSSIGGGCDQTFRLKNDSGSGTPGGDIYTGVIHASSLTGFPSAGLVTLNVSPAQTLSPNTLYWLYLDTCGNSSFYNGWWYSTANPYGGTANRAVDQQSRMAATYDFEFEADVQGVNTYLYYSVGVASSSVFDLTLTSPSFYGGNTYFGNLSTVETDNSQSITYQIQTSTGCANGCSWSAPVTISTSTAFPPITNRYLRYIATLNSNNVSQTPVLSTVTIALETSTGTYYSAVHNASALTSWSTFGVGDTNTGISSITYYTRSSTNTFTTFSSTPTWISQGKNSMVTASTGTWFQMRGDFYVSAATETATLNDFTFNWFEGSASDKAYITYFQDAIWFSVSGSSSVSTNNQIFYLDLLNNAWLKHNITANGFLVENNFLYFGDPTQGRIFKYGGVTTDNSSAINSYWKSKDFTGDNPTVQNEFVQADFTFAQSLSTATYVYNIDQARVSTSILLPTYDSAASIVKRGVLLANGKIGTFYNFQVGDNSSNAKWTLMFHRAHYNALNWVPQTR